MKVSEIISPMHRSVMPLPHSGCWIWVAASDQNGYGSLRFGGKTAKAHRVSWINNRGQIPDGMHVLHKCDVPACVNPDHLFLGTHRDNMRDMMRKGRKDGKKTSRTMLERGTTRGDRHPKAKLTEADVLDIRSSSSTSIDLAAKYGVSRYTIRDMRRVKQRNWRHIR